MEKKLIKAQFIYLHCSNKFNQMLPTDSGGAAHTETQFFNEALLGLYGSLHCVFLQYIECDYAFLTCLLGWMMRSMLGGYHFNESKLI